ncbi:MAG TPA: hypothetical protein DD648_07295 [Candidatus Omnitrophica bacterium]|nr:hypothetical protein [Candidatus Omnitrophota bacterium]
MVCANWILPFFPQASRMVPGRFRWLPMRKIGIISRNKGTGYRVQGTEKKSNLNPEPRTLNPERGFTLIELLLAASILSIIALAILSTFGAGMRAFERVQSFGGFQADVLLFLEGFERDARNTFAFSGVKFKGDSQSMSFASIGTKLDEDGNAFTVLEERSYGFDSSQKALVEKEEDFAPAVSSVTEGSVRTRQVAPIKAVAFQYYSYRKEIEDGEEKIESGWQGTWTDEETIPRGVKVELTFEEGGQEVSLARTVFIPSGGDIGSDEEEEEEQGDGSDG